jgi:hypothetical protein
MLAEQIKPEPIYYDNPELIVIEGLIRQLVSPQELFLRHLAQKKKKLYIIMNKYKDVNTQIKLIIIPITTKFPIQCVWSVNTERG